MAFNPNRSIILKNVRARYLNIFEPEFNKQKGKELYSCQIIFDKKDKDNYDRIMAAIEAAKSDKFGDNVPRKLKLTLRDGDDENDLPESASPGDEPFAGNFFMNVSTGDKPAVVGRNPKNVLTPIDVQDGDYFNISINASAYDVDGSKGVTFYLNNLQYFKRGELMSNKVSAENQFETYDDEELEAFE